MKFSEVCIWCIEWHHCKWYWCRFITISISHLHIHIKHLMLKFTASKKLCLSKISHVLILPYPCRDANAATGRVFLPDFVSVDKEPSTGRKHEELWALAANQKKNPVFSNRLLLKSGCDPGQALGVSKCCNISYLYHSVYICKLLLSVNI